MNMTYTKLSEEQVRLGEAFSSLLFDLSASKALDTKDKFEANLDAYDGPLEDLIRAYLKKEIGSVEALYHAMTRIVNNE